MTILYLKDAFLTVLVITNVNVSSAGGIISRGASNDKSRWRVASRATGIRAYACVKFVTRLCNEPHRLVPGMRDIGRSCALVIQPAFAIIALKIIASAFGPRFRQGEPIESVD